MIRVFLADDHGMVREGVRQVIESQEDMSVVGEADSIATLFRALETTEVDILLLDLSFPEMSGLPLVRQLVEQGRTFSIIVLTMYPEDQLAAHLLRAGAAAYLCKSRSPEELIAAVRAVYTDGRYVPQPLEQDVGDGGELAPHERLSARESQVFFLLIAGKMTAEVGQILELSTPTVSNHIAVIRDKLGATSVNGILLYAHRAGLLP